MRFWFALLLFALHSAYAADTRSAADALMDKAQAAHALRSFEKAIDLATQAIAAEPKNPQTYWVRARVYVDRKDHEKAIADFTRGLELAPSAPQVLQLRGAEYFKAGKFKEAIADFDAAIKLYPKHEPYDWQRGIAHYYAGRYADGQRQFEMHQTVNSNDVENAVWHFLCASRVVGVEKARALLLPIKDDPRVPMMTIYALFAGKAKPQDVIDRAQGNYSSTDQLTQQMFFAHLYLGLYYEAHGDTKLAREHINRAAKDFKQGHYMGDVARVHARLLADKRPIAQSPP